MIKGEQTRHRMIGATAALLRRKGQFATGLNEIVQLGNALRSSVYFHFPGGKDELAGAALQLSTAGRLGRRRRGGHRGTR